MARWTYYKSNGDFNDFHREWDGLAAIDCDLYEVCPNCYTLASRLQIPSFLVFYKKVGQGSLAFRIKRLWLSNAEFELMNEDEWVRELYQLQHEHKQNCKYETKIRSPY